MTWRDEGKVRNFSTNVRYYKETKGECKLSEKSQFFFCVSMLAAYTALLNKKGEETANKKGE